MFTQNSISKDLQDSIRKVMEGNIKHPNQQKIDVHEPEKDEITADDFKKLRAMKKGDKIQKEDTDIQIQELAGKAAQQAAIAISLIKAGKKDGKMPKPMKEATNVTVHNGEAEGSVPKTPREKELAAKHGHKNRITMGDVLKARGVVQKEEVVQADEATALERLKGVGGPRAAQNLPMGHAGKVTMKHVMKSDATPQVKAAIKKAAPDIKTYGDRAAALNAAGIRREEVEELDELSRTTLGSYAKKATRDAVITRKIGADFEHQGNRAKSPGMKAASNTLSQRYKAKSFKRRDGVDKAVDRLTKEEVEQFDETVLVHATYEIKESYTFGEYLTAAKYLVGDDEAVELANEAFKVQDTGIFAEELSSMDIMSRINSHRKAGHTVTEPKYSTKAGKPYHEYVVTDKETGTRRKYIHHGDVSKVENMGAKPKKDEQ